jgi:hypothetical protein
MRQTTTLYPERVVVYKERAIPLNEMKRFLAKLEAGGRLGVRPFKDRDRGRLSNRIFYEF